MSNLSVDHLLGIKYLTTSDIELIFKTADNFKKIINQPEKRGKYLAISQISKGTKGAIP